MRADAAYCAGFGGTMKKTLSILLTTIAGAAAAQIYQPPRHTQPPPVVPDTIQADMGIELERDRPAQWKLAEHRRMAAALAAVKPQRKGVVDA